MSALFSIYRKCVGVFMVGSAALQIFWVFDAEGKYRRSKYWATAKARVTSLKNTPTNPSENTIVYTFYHNGEMIQGNRMYTTDMWIRHHPLRKNVKLNDDVCIRYDPTDPNNSAVFPHIDRLAQCLLLGNAVCTTFFAYKLLRNLPILPRTII